MLYLLPSDSVKLLLVCQMWSGPAAEAFYETPPLLNLSAFPSLISLLSKSNTIHPYSLLIREFIFIAPFADDLLMGDLQQALKACPNLVSIRLESCTSLSTLLAQFLIDHTPFLSRIELPGCTISDNFLLKLIRGVTSLRHIDISFTNITLSVLPVIVRECQFLETLNMTGCRPSPENMVIDYEASEYYLVGDTLKHYKNSVLSHVSLSFTELTDSMVGYLCRHCDNLKILHFNGCKNLTDTSLNSIAMHCSFITELNFADVTNITDIGIQSLAIHLSVSNQKINSTVQSAGSYSSFQEYIPQVSTTISNTIPLSKINLSNCIYISPPAIFMLASKCPNLTEINLDGCERIIEWYTNQTAQKKPMNGLESFNPFKLTLEEPMDSESPKSDSDSFVSAKSSMSPPRLSPPSRRSSIIQSQHHLVLNRNQILDKRSSIIADQRRSSVFD
ncbi:hypothetical protein BC833DRAFT_617172 [Globomyces pollinis-pini]|nr:hypothetical protein BC833DRAFT_617172 [Globomyces pollinis-pini]